MCICNKLSMLGYVPHGTLCHVIEHWHVMGDIKLNVGKAKGPDWENMAGCWTRCKADQVITPDLEGWLGLTTFWIKRVCGQKCYLVAMHCVPLYRSGLIFKQFNIVSKQSLTSGKFHHPTLSCQSELCPSDQCGEGRGYITYIESLVWEYYFEPHLSIVI